MLIAHVFRALIAVLTLAASFNSVTSNRHLHESKRYPILHEWYNMYYSKDVPLEGAGRLLSLRQNQMLLKQEGRNFTAVDCCPSVLEMVEPEGGKNQDDQYVELYRDGDNIQRFYELSCHQDILNQPCRFMDKKLHEQSKCVQKFSYSYALVKDSGHHHHQRHHTNYFTSLSSGPNETRWRLDYIRVRSGCSCVITPNNKKKRERKNKRPHNG